MHNTLLGPVCQKKREEGRKNRKGRSVDFTVLGPEGLDNIFLKPVHVLLVFGENNTGNIEITPRPLQP
jgi:hypothetical protein